MLLDVRVQQLGGDMKRVVQENECEEAFGQAWAAQRQMLAEGFSLERLQQLTAELLGAQETPEVQAAQDPGGERPQQRRRRIPQQVIAQKISAAVAVHRHPLL